MIIEDFYYGNIEPQECRTPLKSVLKKKLNALSQTEEQLTAKLTDSDKELLEQYINQYNEFLCVSSADGFITGFRLGAKFTYDTFIAD